MLSCKNSNQCFKIFADYGTTGLWMMDKSGIWLSCDPSKTLSQNFRNTLKDWVLYHQSDRIRPELGMASGCISLRMFNAIGQQLAITLQNETLSEVFYQPIKENDLFYKIINDVTHIDHTIKL